MDTLAIKNRMTAGGVEDAHAVAITAAVGMAIEGGIATKADLDALRAHVDVGLANVRTEIHRSVLAAVVFLGVLVTVLNFAVG